MGTERGRVLVALSGGVDSAVAAGLLKEAGHDPIGVTLHLWDASGHNQVGRCCSPEDRDDARRVCDHLGIPHYVFDEREAFRRNVVDPFMQSYLSGETPSPCVHCNRTVKVNHLLEIAERLGATKVATGHYARVSTGDGQHMLLRGRDRDKDQSYFLFGVRPAMLPRLVFPLGELEKSEVRVHARRLALPNADKPDSQELCFVRDGDVPRFIEEHGGTHRPGRLLDPAGRPIGQHAGVSGFTVGQRKGLGLGGGPVRYVLRIEGDDVVVGQEKHLFRSTLTARDVSWMWERPTAPFSAHVRIRYRHEPAPATVQPTATGFDVAFEEPQRAITRGQATVVYRGEEVIGGGFIC